MTILDELADYARVRTAEAKKKRSPEEVKKAAISDNIYSDSRILLSVLYTILIQMEIPLYHLKIKTRIVLNGMKIKEFYVLCVDICD